MNTRNLLTRMRWPGLVLAALAMLAGCATTPQPVCELPGQRDLDRAVAFSQAQLTQGCEARFHAYLDTLLEIAEGDPGPENKQTFSSFLLWASDEGILSRRQSQELYNRYFNVKFMSLAGDYNNCAYTCPRQDKFIDNMESELADKERGLLRVSLDQNTYYRADRLFRETELVLAATCTACAGEAPAP